MALPSKQQFRCRQRDHRQRYVFLARLRQFLQERGRDAIIYLDESGFELDYPTLFAWSPRGQVVDGERSSQRRPRQNLLAARNPQEFLTTVMIAGSIIAMVFET